MNFYPKFWMCFFKVKHSIAHIPGMVGPIDVQWNEVHQLDTFMGPTWGPPGSCQPQMGPMLSPWTLLSGDLSICVSNLTERYWRVSYGCLTRSWIWPMFYLRIYCIVLYCTMIYQEVVVLITHSKIQLLVSWWKHGCLNIRSVLISSVVVLGSFCIYDWTNYQPLKRHYIYVTGIHHIWTTSFWIGMDSSKIFFANERVVNCSRKLVSDVPDARSSNCQLSDEACIYQRCLNLITSFEYISNLFVLYFNEFLSKILNVFLQGQTLYCPYLRNGWSDWCAMKWSASVGY